MQALQQRRDELTKRQQEALSRGDFSKARRMDRLSKVSLFFLTLKMNSYHFLLITAISRSY